MTNVQQLLEAQRLARAGVLTATAAFKGATPAELISICNGCGAANSWFRPPDKIYGTLIIFACIIHDWDYHFGHTIEDKDEADRTFRNNMVRLIERDGLKKWYKPTKLQCLRAQGYYSAVCWFGGPAYWKGKN